MARCMGLLRKKKGRRRKDMNMDTKEGVTDSRAAVRRARELADTAAEQYDEQSAGKTVRELEA